MVVRCESRGKDSALVVEAYVKRQFSNFSLNFDRYYVFLFLIFKTSIFFDDNIVRVGKALSKIHREWSENAPSSHSAQIGFTPIALILRRPITRRKYDFFPTAPILRRPTTRSKPPFLCRVFAPGEHFYSNPD